MEVQVALVARRRGHERQALLARLALDVDVEVHAPAHAASAEGATSKCSSMKRRKEPGLKPLPKHWCSGGQLHMRMVNVCCGPTR